MKTDEQIKQDWLHLDNDNIEKACAYLREHEYAIQDYMAELVASLCDVDPKEMLSETSVAYLSQARAFYWYAIRYMNNETYDKIAERTAKRGGFHFTPNGIGQAINKIARLVDTEPIWIKRWTIIKRIIKLRDNTDESTDKDTCIRIVAPKGVKVEIKNE